MSIQHFLVAGIIALMLTACSDDEKVTQHTDTSAASSSYTPKYGAKFIDKAAPNFSVENLKGGKIALSQYKGKAVLINFWATWCPPCRAEIPEFVDVYNELSNKDFTIIGIAMDQKELVSEFVDEFEVSYPIAFGADDVSKIAVEYGNTMGALPYNVIINRDHKIIYAEPGPLSKQRLLNLITPLF